MAYLFIKGADDCSVGMVEYNLLEAHEKLDTSGLYLLVNEPIMCTGTLVSWHTCFFYSSFDVDHFRLRVAVYRVDNDLYDLVQGSLERINKLRGDSDDEQGCVDHPLSEPLAVLQGDIIAVIIANDCVDDESICPLFPNLNRNSSALVYYMPGIESRIHHSEFTPVNHYINIMASISKRSL